MDAEFDDDVYIDPPFEEEPAYIPDDRLRHVAREWSLLRAERVGAFFDISSKPGRLEQLEEDLFQHGKEIRDRESAINEPPLEWYL